MLFVFRFFHLIEIYIIFCLLRFTFVFCLFFGFWFFIYLFHLKEDHKYLKCSFSVSSLLASPSSSFRFVSFGFLGVFVVVFLFGFPF